MIHPVRRHDIRCDVIFRQKIGVFVSFGHCTSVGEFPGEYTILVAAVIGEYFKKKS